MAEKVKSVDELKADVEFWRKAFEESDNEKKKFVAVIEQQSKDLVEARHTGTRLADISEKLIKENVELRKHLKLVLLHVGGRTGMQDKSKKFCGICQNPHLCPTGPANEYFDGLAAPKPAVAA